MRNAWMSYESRCCVKSLRLPTAIKIYQLRLRNAGVAVTTVQHSERIILCGSSRQTMHNVFPLPIKSDRQEEMLKYGMCSV
jgi:hypothetical protein